MVVKPVAAVLGDDGVAFVEVGDRGLLRIRRCTVAALRVSGRGFGRGGGIGCNFCRPAKRDAFGRNCSHYGVRRYTLRLFGMRRPIDSLVGVMDHRAYLPARRARTTFRRFLAARLSRATLPRGRRM